MAGSQDGSDLLNRASQLLANAFVWDAHAGFETIPGMDLDALRRWKDAGVNFLSLNVGYDVRAWSETIKSLAFARVWIQRSEHYSLVGTARDIEIANAAGQMAIAFDLEGMNALDGSVDMVRFYYDLGVRQMLFAYNVNNAAGGGCHDEDIGLTDFGRSVLAEMNEVGMLVDCSHCGYRTTMEAIEGSSAPVIFSHSNAWRLRDHERNIFDEQARACAATGGVVGVNGIGDFLGQDDISTHALADHVEYWLDVVGPEHVGIGLDYFFGAEAVGVESGFNETLGADSKFWPPAQYPNGSVRCAAPEQIPGLAAELLRRRRPESEIRAVLGGNFLRVAREVWE